MKNNIIEFKLHAPRPKMIDERIVYEFMDYLIFNTQEFTFDPTDPDSAHGSAEFWQKPPAEIIAHLSSQYEAAKDFFERSTYWLQCKDETKYPEHLRNLPHPTLEKKAELERLDGIKTMVAIEAITAQPHVFELVCQTLKSIETKENGDVIGFIGDALQSIKVADNHGYYELNYDVFERFAGALANESRKFYPRDGLFEALGDNSKETEIMKMFSKHLDWDKQIDDVVLQLVNNVIAGV